MNKPINLFIFSIIMGLLCSCISKPTSNLTFKLNDKLKHNIAQKHLTKAIDSINIAAITNRSNDKFTNGHLQFYKAKKNYINKKNKIALQYLQKAESNLGDIKESCGYICYYKSKIHYESNQFNEGYQIALTGIDHFNSIKDSTGAAYLSILIANNFARKKNLKGGLLYYQKANDLTKNSSNQKLIKNIKLNLASYYIENDSVLKAFAIYNNLLNNFKLTNREKSKVHNNLAVAYIHKKNWIEAINNLKIAKELKHEIKDSVGYAIVLNNILSSQIKAGKINEAKISIKEIIPYTSFLSKNQKVEFKYNKLTLHLKEEGEYQTINSINSLIQLKDSLSNIAFSDKLIEIQKSFEIQERDKNIALLEKEDELNEARLRNQLLIIISVGVLALVLLVLGYFILRQRNRLRKSERHLQKQQSKIKNINEELHLSNQAKDKILSIIGHDLRGPIGGLKELIELYMELPNFEPNDIANLLKSARESSTNTYHLLENLLTWANSQRGEIEYKPVVTPLLPLIKQSINVLESSINTRNVRFRYNIAANIFATADLNMLRTIMRNLVSNAVKYSPPDSNIRISAVSDHIETTICINDEGYGMSAEESTALFEKKETFFLESGYNAKGTGLGLILCKDFVDLHKGRIWVESEKGKGTAVYFTLPHDEANQQTTSKTKNKFTVTQ